MLTDSFSAITHLHGTYHRQFQIPDLPLICKQIIIFSNKTYSVLIFAKIHITESYLGKYLEPRKEPLQKFGTGKTCRHLSLF